MNESRFLNQFQPQTLVIGLGIGGFGIANEKRWGYSIAVAAAVLQVLVLVGVAGVDVLSFPLIINLLFDGALVALLLHSQSREYHRIWFK